MDNLSLLDCTLRDGGYINDWAFGRSAIRDILQKLAASGVEMIELGFLRDCEYDKDKTLFDHIGQAEALLAEAMPSTSTYALMALHGAYDAAKLPAYGGGPIDTIRVTFHDYDAAEGLAFAQTIVAKGYRCFCNPINIMGYTDGQLLALVERVNQIRPHGFSIVDTFGALRPEDLARLYALVEQNLDPAVTLGLHLHENLGLSFALARHFLELRAPGRPCVIDASLLGMGRMPGNLCLELAMDHLNRCGGKRYQTHSALDAIARHIQPYKQAKPWGYSPAYALSAQYNLHRSYAQHLVEKGTLRTVDIDHILAAIAPQKKSAFDAAYIEALYQDYVNRA